MSAVSTLTGLTIDQYLSYEAPEGFRDELIDGEIILSPVAKPNHNDISLRLSDLLRSAVRGSGFIVRQEMNMRLDAHNSMPSPDVFIIDRARWNTAKEASGYPLGSPELAIEVLSPSNRNRKFQRKLELYLQTGSLAVWVVYLETKTVRVHDGNGVREFGSNETVQLPAPLPSAAIAVADIFAPPD